MIRQLAKFNWLFLAIVFLPVQFALASLCEPIVEDVAKSIYHFELKENVEIHTIALLVEGVNGKRYWVFSQYAGFGHEKTFFAFHEKQPVQKILWGGEVHLTLNKTSEQNSREGFRMISAKDVQVHEAVGTSSFVHGFASRPQHIPLLLGKKGEVTNSIETLESSARRAGVDGEKAEYRLYDPLREHTVKELNDSPLSSHEMGNIVSKLVAHFGFKGIGKTLDHAQAKELEKFLKFVEVAYKTRLIPWTSAQKQALQKLRDAHAMAKERADVTPEQSKEFHDSTWVIYREILDRQNNPIAFVIPL